MVTHIDRCLHSGLERPHVGISVYVTGNHVKLTGLISSAARREALNEIVREHLRDAEIDDQVQLVEKPEPHDLEEMS